MTEHSNLTPEEQAVLNNQKQQIKRPIHPSQKQTDKAFQPVETGEIARVYADNTRITANRFHQQTAELNQELAGAIQANQRYVEQASDVLVELHRTTKARIFAAAVEKIENLDRQYEKPEQIADSQVFEVEFGDFFALPGIPIQRNLTGS
ncbi:hypothetical protein IQ268_08705 [Oculatella sp. LEGE 06141]|uniref:hypothetical protein n=1 Tax=Oculatella sp. LEGE 06141 TaxID=1828648 RepID=UPI0018820456|nr:hypothetical protein [Oculatella sp. LEGE 06141]MBE9178638.1 hypothetical protein [Oculatella sp. LEGE 06141]